MSGSLNKVMLIGNLGDEVKMHHFDGGGCIGRFPIATNESYTNKTTGKVTVEIGMSILLTWEMLLMEKIFLTLISHLKL